MPNARPGSIEQIDAIANEAQNAQINVSNLYEEGLSSYEHFLNFCRHSYLRMEDTWSKQRMLAEINKHSATVSEVVFEIARVGAEGVVHDLQAGVALRASEYPVLPQQK